MTKMIKYLKPFWLSILLIFGFLFSQAQLDLALPDYMSKIVNIGIQQGGIEDAVPEVIRVSEAEKLRLFLTDGEWAQFDSHYEKISSGDDYDSLLKKYPEMNGEIYKLKKISSDERAALADTLAKGEAVTLVLRSDEFDKSQLQGLPEGMDPVDYIAALPEEARQQMLAGMESQLSEISTEVLTQAGTVYVKQEYQALGRSASSIQTSYILRIGGWMLLLAGAGLVCAIVVGYLSARVAAGFSRQMRQRVFAKVESFSAAEFDKFSTASLITRTTNDVQQIQMVLVMLFRTVFYAPIMGVGGVIRVLQTDSSITWIIALAVVLLLGLLAVAFAIAMPKFKLMQKLTDRLNLVTRESLTGTLVIRAFNTQEKEVEKFEGANQDITKNQLFINRFISLMMPVMMLIMNVTTLGIVWFGSKAVDLGTMQVGNMMAFMQYSMQIIMSFLMVAIVFIMIPRASVSAQRISEVLETEPQIKDPASPKHMNPEKKGLVEFKNVSFQYPGAEDPVLKNLNFVAEPGKTTAFIGSTGSGKSTIINLIPRFYDVTEGSITVGGVDVRELSQYELHDRIGYVPQKATLFAGTIKSNLQYGDEDASDEQLKLAAKIAQAEDFIEQKEDGYDSLVSQGGSNVSGGQKQRLSIARALVKNPDVFILDDSFSALDFKTDAALRAALGEYTDGTTVLIVGQRISTIMNADQIVVLDAGNVVGIGTHKELLKDCDVYREIAQSQLSEEELA